MFHFRGSFLEVGCVAVVHPRPPLAWRGVCSPFGAALEINGVWYDRILHSTVTCFVILSPLVRAIRALCIVMSPSYFICMQHGECVSDVAQEGRHFQFDRLRPAGRAVRHGQRRPRRQTAVVQTVRRRRRRCGKNINGMQYEAISFWLDLILTQHQYHTKIDELIERTSSTMSQGISL